MASAIERGISASRWLLAPLYLGLAVSLLLLLVKFVQGTLELALKTVTAGTSKLITGALSLVDLSLMGNLLVMVMFAVYENFVSRFGEGTKGNRPDWIGNVGFGALKLKPMTLIIAIAGVPMLEDCKSPPKCDPSKNSDNSFKHLAIVSLRWGPDRLRSGSQLKAGIRLYIGYIHLLQRGVTLRCLFTAGLARIIVLVLDNAGWHGAANLKIPDGIRLIYLPPYSPELQPAETIWALVDEPIVNKHIATIEELDRKRQPMRCPCRTARANPNAHWLPLVAKAHQSELITRKPYHSHVLIWFARANGEPPNSFSGMPQAARC